MNLRTYVPWILCGGLLASSVWNALLVGRVARLEARAPAVETPALPATVVQDLALTREQCSTIGCCADNCSTERAVMATEAAACAERLRAALRAADADPERITELARELGELQVRQLVRLARSIAEVRATLTPEQRARLRDGDD